VLPTADVPIGTGGEGVQSINGQFGNLHWVATTRAEDRREGSTVSARTGCAVAVKLHRHLPDSVACACPYAAAWGGSHFVCLSIAACCGGTFGVYTATKIATVADGSPAGRTGRDHGRNRVLSGWRQHRQLSGYGRDQRIGHSLPRPGPKPPPERPQGHPHCRRRGSLTDCAGHDRSSGRTGLERCPVHNTVHHHPSEYMPAPSSASTQLISDPGRHSRQSGSVPWKTRVLTAASIGARSRTGRKAKSSAA